MNEDAVGTEQHNGNGAGDAPPWPNPSPTPELSPQVSAPRLSREEFLEYKLLLETLRHRETLVGMHERELNRATQELNETLQAMRANLAALGNKYSVSMVTHAITEDGFIVTRHPAAPRTPSRGNLG